MYTSEVRRLERQKKIESNRLTKENEKREKIENKMKEKERLAAVRTKKMQALEAARRLRQEKRKNETADI